MPACYRCISARLPTTRQPPGNRPATITPLPGGMTWHGLAPDGMTRHHGRESAPLAATAAQGGGQWRCGHQRRLAQALRTLTHVRQAMRTPWRKPAAAGMQKIGWARARQKPGLRLRCARDRGRTGRQEPGPGAFAESWRQQPQPPRATAQRAWRTWRRRGRACLAPGGRTAQATAASPKQASRCRGTASARRLQARPQGGSRARPARPFSARQCQARRWPDPP